MLFKVVSFKKIYHKFIKFFLSFLVRKQSSIPAVTRLQKLTRAFIKKEQQLQKQASSQIEFNNNQENLIRNWC